MIKIECHEEPEEVKRLWQRYWPQKCLFDLWPVRNCFHSQFDRKPFFIVAMKDGVFQGMLALSWIEEENVFGHFPGEVWQGNTWLEQNKILAGNPEIYLMLLECIPADIKIRYLSEERKVFNPSTMSIDEIGYLFYPMQYDYSFEVYKASFSGKFRKRLRSELNRLGARGVFFRHDCLSDLDHMFRMNLETYKEDSYFSDPRFLRAFERLASWFHNHGMLKITAVIVDGVVAAVDMGAIWNSKYTVLAGATNADFPGVAKIINLHHIEWACLQKLIEVDFLCGDYNWKNRFHLTPRPLYKISRFGINGEDIVSDRSVAFAG